MPLTKCLACPNEISDYWQLCNDCRAIRAAKRIAETKAAMPRPTLPDSDPIDILGVWGLYQDRPKRAQNDRGGPGSI